MHGKAINSTYRRYERRLVLGSQTADYALPWVTDHRTSRNNQKSIMNSSRSLCGEMCLF